MEREIVVSLEPVELGSNRLRCGWREFEASAEKAVFAPLPPQEIICGEVRTIALETDFVLFYWLHKSSQSQIALGLDNPAISSLILQWPHSFIPYSTILSIRRQSSPERQDGFLVPQEFPSGCPRNISQRGKSHGHCSAAWVEATTWNAPHRFCLSWVLVWVHFFFFFLIFFKGIWAWHAEMERWKFISSP